MAKSEEFNKGWWNCIQTVLAEGGGEGTVYTTIKAAGFTYEECLELMKASDYKANELLAIVNNVFGLGTCEQCGKTGVPVKACYDCGETFCSDCGGLTELLKYPLCTDCYIDGNARDLTND